MLKLRLYEIGNGVMNLSCLTIHNSIHSFRFHSAYNRFQTSGKTYSVTRMQHLGMIGLVKIIATNLICNVFNFRASFGFYLDTFALSYLLAFSFLIAAGWMFIIGRAMAIPPHLPFESFVEECNTGYKITLICWVFLFCEMFQNILFSWNQVYI